MCLSDVAQPGSGVSGVCHMRYCHLELTYTVSQLGFSCAPSAEDCLSSGTRSRALCAREGDHAANPPAYTGPGEPVGACGPSPVGVPSSVLWSVLIGHLFQVERTSQQSPHLSGHISTCVLKIQKAHGYIFWDIRPYVCGPEPDSYHVSHRPGPAGLPCAAQTQRYLGLCQRVRKARCVPGSRHLPAHVCSCPNACGGHGGTAALRPCGCHTVLFFSLSRQIEQLLELLTAEVLSPDSQAPSGVKSHFLEIFLEELTKVGAAEVRGLRWGWGWGAVSSITASPSLGSHSSPQTRICSSSSPSAR